MVLQVSRGADRRHLVRDRANRTKAAIGSAQRDWTGRIEVAEPV